MGIIAGWLVIKKSPLTEEQRKAKSILATGKPHPISEEARQRLIEWNKIEFGLTNLKRKFVSPIK
jgi:hypothetical protein